MSEIHLTRKAAETLYEVHDRLEAAERHFQACQSASYRQYVRRLLSAGELKGALLALRASLEAPEAAPSRPRKVKEARDAEGVRNAKNPETDMPQ